MACIRDVHEADAPLKHPLAHLAAAARALLLGKVVPGALLVGGVDARGGDVQRLGRELAEALGAAPRRVLQREERAVAGDEHVQLAVDHEAEARRPLEDAWEHGEQGARRAVSRGGVLRVRVDWVRAACVPVATWRGVDDVADDRQVEVRALIAWVELGILDAGLGEDAERKGRGAVGGPGTERTGVGDVVDVEAGLLQHQCLVDEVANP